MTRKTTRRSERGFTLAELLVVLAIIGLLTTLVVINVLPMQDRARGSKARADLATIEQALELQRLDAGRYPTTAEGLATLSAGGPAGSMLKALPQDPWGKPYQYRSPGTEGAPYDLFSLGSDGEPGGEGPAADIRAGAKP